MESKAQHPFTRWNIVKEVFEIAVFLVITISHFVSGSFCQTDRLNFNSYSRIPGHPWPMTRREGRPQNLGMGERQFGSRSGDNIRFHFGQTFQCPFHEFRYCWREIVPDKHVGWNSAQRCILMLPKRSPQFVSLL